MKSYTTQKLTLLSLALFFTSTVWADGVTEAQALEQAQSFLAEQPTASGRPRHAQAAKPQLTLASKVSGLYVFNVAADDGFVIVSNDDRTVPILGFSESGSFNADNMPDNMKAWLQGYADEIAWLNDHPQTSQRVNARRQVGSHSTTAISPLVTSKWNQDTPYNNLCPTYSYYSSSKSATGCVATAMAQVMYYHKWPKEKTSTIPGYTSYSYNLTLSSLPAVVLDWTNMKDSYSGSYTSAQGTAVATLMKYCGYSVQMDYGPESGAYTEDVATALVNYFDYNASTTRFISRSSYSYANWTDIIYHELANKRPVVYGGMSTGGGHEFVCDGYKYQSGTDFFHINWGWGGMSDNYFVLSALDPDSQGIGGSTSTDGFHYGQDAVIGIQKSTDNGTLADIAPNVVDLTVNSITPSSNPTEPNTAVDIVFNVTNNSADDYDGDIWLCQEESGNYNLVELNSVVIPAGQTQNCTISYTPTEVGTYTLMFAYINGEGEYIVYDGVSTTLTVAQAVTNGVVPIYGYWADNLTKSQFIIAEAELEDMLDCDLNSMTFTASEQTVSWGAAKFDVYLQESEQATISSLKAWDTLQKVYSGSLSISGGKMTVTFAEPYFYQGGNLLVGFNQTATGSYSKSTWRGEKVTGASVGGYGSSISQQNFLPNVFFDFTPGSGTHVAKPKELAVSYTGGTEAVVSWTSDAPAFDIEVNGNVTEDVDNPCTLTGLDLATIYIIKVRAKQDDAVSDWTDAVSFTTDLSSDLCQVRLELTDAFGDGWNGAAIKVVDVLTGTELGSFSNTSEAGKGEAQTYIADVPYDRDIEFQWVKGNYDQECSYAAYDVNGNEIFSGKGAMKESVAYHVVCTLPVYDIVLTTGDDNTALIAAHDGRHCNVTLQGRTFFRDGLWNTVCLPFNLTLAGSPLEGADVRTPTDATLLGSTAQLSFTEEGEVTAIAAGVPYIIRWAAGDDLQNPVFTDVVIDQTTHDAAFELAGGLAIAFRGTYARTAFADTYKSILFMGEGNRPNPATEKSSISAQRAYFELQGFQLSDADSPVKEIVLNLGEDNPTALSHAKQSDDLSDASAPIYDVSGRRISEETKSSLRKGIYIIRGRKVMVR